MIPVTYIIIGVTAAISIWCFSNRELKYKLTFSPYSARHQKKWYNVVTHAFVHADYIHLGVNMYVLYSFGRIVDDTMVSGRYENEILVDLFGGMGLFYFILLYIGGIIFATLPAFRKHADNPNYLAVGASGAVSAVLFASIMLEPITLGREGIYLLFIPIKIQPVIFGILYLLYEAYMDKRGRDNVAHDAHFWGGVFGLLFIIIVRPATVTEFISSFGDWFANFGA